MKTSTRRILYATVLTVGLLSAIIYGKWREIAPMWFIFLGIFISYEVINYFVIKKRIKGQ